MKWVNLKGTFKLLGLITFILIVLRSAQTSINTSSYPKDSNPKDSKKILKHRVKSWSFPRLGFIRLGLVVLLLVMLQYGMGNRNLELATSNVNPPTSATFKVTPSRIETYSILYNRFQSKQLLKEFLNGKMDMPLSPPLLIPLITKTPLPQLGLRPKASPLAARRRASAPSNPATPNPAVVNNYVNYLRSDNGQLHTSVVPYSDCSGAAAVPQGMAVLDTCAPTPYFMGHNYGVFTPLMSMGDGAIINYWDGGGNLHVYKIIAERDIDRIAQPLIPPLVPGANAQFQTCITADSKYIRVFDVQQIN